MFNWNLTRKMKLECQSEPMFFFIIETTSPGKPQSIVSVLSPVY